ncbi:hypothetical protein C8Q74DRAFT_1213079 [Fomes fomentarius]|nr:hypothetical protein C8Q74DRAFT_1213079 [Fomes fomentarius]
MAYLQMYYLVGLEDYLQLQSPYGPPSFMATQSIGFVNLACLTGEWSILPTAFLICSTLGEDIVQGFKHMDQSQEYLMQDDLRLCISVMHMLYLEGLRLTIHLLGTGPSSSCYNVLSCNQAYGSTQSGLVETIPYLLQDDPFNSQQWFVVLQGKLCNSCKHELWQANMAEKDVSIGTENHNLEWANLSCNPIGWYTARSEEWSFWIICVAACYQKCEGGMSDVFRGGSGICWSFAVLRTMELWCTLWQTQDGRESKA